MARAGTTTTDCRPAPTYPATSCALGWTCKRLALTSWPLARCTQAGPVTAGSTPTPRWLWLLHGCWPALARGRPPRRRARRARCRPQMTSRPYLRACGPRPACCCCPDRPATAVPSTTTSRQVCLSTLSGPALPVTVAVGPGVPIGCTSSCALVSPGRAPSTTPPSSLSAHRGGWQGCGPLGRGAPGRHSTRCTPSSCCSPCDLAGLWWA